MINKIKNTIKTWLVGAATGILTVTMTIGGVLPVSAASTSSGSLTVIPVYNKIELNATTYDGTFTVYQVAKNVETGEFDKTGGFEDYSGEISNRILDKDSSLNKDDNKAYHDLTDGLAAYLESHKSSISPVLDDVKAGETKDLGYGLYLVVQNKVGKGYEKVSPFLVLIPVYGEGSTDPNAVAYPKLELNAPSNLTSNDPPIKKVVKGNPPAEDEFWFTIIADPADAGYPLPAETQISVTTKDEAEKEFGTITFKATGTYRYIVAEKAGALKGYTYDKTIYYVQYDVSVDAENGLVVNRTITVDSRDGETTDEIVFTNTYKRSGGGGDDHKHHDDPTPTPGKKGQVALGKVDAADGTVLAGVQFNLYKNDGTLYGTYTTDEDGIIYIDQLAYGSYYFVESKTLVGYQLDQTPWRFNVYSDDTVQLVVTNAKVPEAAVPEESGAIDNNVGGATGDTSMMTIYGVVCVVAAAALVGWIVIRRRENNA